MCAGVAFSKNVSSSTDNIGYIIPHQVWILEEFTHLCCKQYIPHSWVVPPPNLIQSNTTSIDLNLLPCPHLPATHSPCSHLPRPHSLQVVRHFLDEYDQYQQYRGVPCPGFQSQVSDKCDVCVGGGRLHLFTLCVPSLLHPLRVVTPALCPPPLTTSPSAPPSPPPGYGESCTACIPGRARAPLWCPGGQAGPALSGGCSAEGERRGHGGGVGTGSVDGWGEGVQVT